ncbi:hemolysin III family protein [Colwellia sp. M166]|uniref:PAQR family membrane homeostasis protein TrhA n=1 Tax=Colwellia sp. M166 TaxID=2583805 RepID=UPI00211E1CB4|nr:hemolysin III family protein [Colwellia sp. M166]UUO23246.1 hemolysin III family protein [Colwellia sp. M166]
MQTQDYGLAEEIINAISHGLAALLSVAGLTLLVTLAWLQADITKVISFSIYGASLVLLFSASTLYHALLHDKAKRIFKLLDHCAIYLLIAGTYTPLMLVTLADDVGYIILSIIWGLALSGIAFKIKFGNKYKKLSLATYLGLGLISLIFIDKLNVKLAAEGIFLLALGGIIYGLGTIFYIRKNKQYSHAIWHLFVFMAALCHFFMMFFYVL